MKKDFSISGREKFLSETFFTPKSGFDDGWFTFARWTLLQRVLWRYVSEGYFCHLDGFTFDKVDEFDDGFLGVGRVFLLDNSKTKGGIYTAMAIKFSGVPKKVVSGKVWVSKMPVVKGIYPDHIPIADLSEILESYKVFGMDWNLALYRTSSGWSLRNGFDPSIFFTADND